MKFKIIPAETIELELFQKDDKRVWVWVTWNRIDRTELDSADYDFADGCENEEQLQKAFDKIMSTATPAKKDSKDEHQKLIQEDTYNISEIERVTKIEYDYLINSSSGGGLNSQVWSWENVTEEDKQQKVKDEDKIDDDDEEFITLEQAAESYRDQVLEEFGYGSVAGETYYTAPLKVVEVKE